MKNFWDIVNDVIGQSDIVMEILDARFVEETRNKELEDRIRAKGKKLIFVINKCDLAEKGVLEKKKRELNPCVFVSAIKRFGITMLLHEIQRHADKSQERVVVGVVGYPNTGKSSVINALKGRASAPVSPQSGFTKALQLIRITSRIYLLDTPGVYSYMEKDTAKHALISSMDFSRIKDPESAVISLLEYKRKAIASHYGVKELKDSEALLVEIAVKMNKVKKGGVPDTKLAAQMLLKDWQRGKIRII